MSKIDPHSLLEKALRYPHIMGWLAGKNDLTQMHSQWAWDLWGAPTGVHTGIQAHRGGFKTTILVEVGILWHLLANPNDSVMLVRETWTESCKTLKAISKYFEVPEIKALFAVAHGIEPRMIVNKTGQITFNFKKNITKEGSIDAYGGASVPTGAHYDRILIDDLITVNDRISRAKRELSKDIIREITVNIINRGGSVHFVGTPWHKDDGWQLVSDAGVDIKKHNCYETGLISPQELAKLKSMTTASLFAANYELKHLSDEGAIFTDPVFGDWDFSVPYQWVAAHIDAKFQGDHYNALTIASKRKMDDKIQIHGQVFTEHVEKIVPRVKDILYKFKCTKIHIEENPDKGFVANLFENNEPSRLKIRPARVSRYHESMNKHVKIVTYGSLYWPRLIFTNSTDTQYLSHVLDYREFELPDDAPDSMASLMRQEFFPSDPANRAARNGRWS